VNSQLPDGWDVYKVHKEEEIKSDEAPTWSVNVVWNIVVVVVLVQIGHFMTSVLLCIAWSFDKCGEREKIVLQNFFSPSWLGSGWDSSLLLNFFFLTWKSVEAYKSGPKLRIKVPFESFHDQSLFFGFRLWQQISCSWWTTMTPT
jgi:hypothetical protein